MATIVRAWGSTPREVGAKMLVTAQGEIHGTIGGGCGEAEVWEEVQELFGGGRARTVHVDLTEDPESDSGKVCGGRYDVFVELWRPQSMALAGSILSALERGRELVLATVLGLSTTPSWKRGAPAPPLDAPSQAAGTRVVCGPQDEEGDLAEICRAALAQRSDGVVRVPLEGVEHDVFVEVLAASPRLVIAGAGHIARPLCAMASLCGYAVTVMDDRPDYADRARFPEADRVVCDDFEHFFETVPAGPGSHFVLVTRGHKHDQDCLRRLVGREATYVGMIGSRRRVKAVFAELVREGADPAWLEEVHAPIGLDIGAHTPEEIAVCILAEMIKIRRGGTGASLSRDARKLVRKPV